MRVEAKRLSETVVKAAKPKAGRYLLKDTEEQGLYLRVEPSGKRSFHVLKKVRGRMRSMKLDDWPTLAVRDARDEVREIKRALHRGENPFDAREVSEDWTLGGLWERWLEVKRSKLAPLTIRNAELQYGKHVKKRLGGRKAAEISTGDVEALLEKVAKDHGPIAANRTRALLSSIFSSAKKLGVGNPVHGTDPRPEKARDRHLSAEEMGAFLRAVLADKDRDTRDALRLLLFTAARKANILGAEWSWVDLKAGVLAVPAEATKGGKRPLVVPLVPAAVEILEERRKAAKPGERYVFPSRPGSARPHLYDIRAALRRVLERAKLEGLTPHDLRRTCATWLVGSGGAGVLLASTLLGHSSGAFGTTGIYARADCETVRPYLVKAVEAMLATLDEEAGEVVAFPAGAAS